MEVNMSTDKGKTKTDSKNPRMELEYLPPPAPFYQPEGLKEKLVRKTKENPFVPLGEDRYR